MSNLNKTTAANLEKTPSVLAFERRIDISDGFFWQCDSTKPDGVVEPLMVREKAVRGTISNRLKKGAKEDPTKLDPDIQKPNLQVVDVAALDEDKDTLVVKWICKVLPFGGIPNVCNNQEYQQKIMKIVEEYKHEHGLRELALRYAINIVNGRWLWRNRLGAQDIQIMVNEQSLTTELKFNAREFELNNFVCEHSDVKQLASLIELGFKGEKFVLFKVEAKLSTGFGQEVYPSQELILGNSKGGKSKVLYVIKDKAALHSQKIGNAIRTIDNWYEDATFPIPIEPYGAVTTLGTAFRKPQNKEDFYTLLDNWVLKGKKPDVNQQHYVMGVLIRGGIFGEKEKGGDSSDKN